MTVSSHITWRALALGSIFATINAAVNMCQSIRDVTVAAAGRKGN